jgi:hypothetical protein
MGASKPVNSGRFKTSQVLDVHRPSFFPCWKQLLIGIPHHCGSALWDEAVFSHNLLSLGERTFQNELNSPLLG